jgi:DNA helicase-2/ATP-dependent DNA helicase PcrA
MLDFQVMFNAQVISLNENYRSDQSILDAATRVIENNAQNLSNYFPGLSERLTSSNASISLKELSVFELPNPMAETAFLVQRIKGLLADGVVSSDIAVIYRKHRLADELIQQLKANDINFNIRRSINVLDTVIVRQMLNILRYIVSIAESYSRQDSERKLFEILHYRFFENDIKKIHTYYLKLVDVDDQARRPKDIIKTEECLSELTGKYHNETIVQLMHAIINDTGMLTFILRQKDRTEQLLYLTTFFNWVKEEGFKNTDLNGETLLAMIDKMKENGLYLPVITMHAFNEGVNLTTAHGAKGLEWDHVFILGANRNEWEGARTPVTSYSMPSTLTKEGTENKVESNRRLFYVAMTRAKVFCSISYAAKTNVGKDLERSQFVDETGLEIQEGHIENVPEFLGNTMFSGESMIDVEREVVMSRLEDFTMSVSALNKYLKCQRSFYYENVLRIPFVATPALIFGNAIHVAMKQAYDSIKAGKRPTWNEFIMPFTDYLLRNKIQLTTGEFERRLFYGETLLLAYYEKVLPLSNTVTLNEYKVRRITIEGVPVKGDIDKIEFAGNLVDVIDYKTGNAVNAKKKMNAPSDKDPIGGDYWRQLVMYKLFIDNLYAKEWKYRSSFIDMLDEDGCTRLGAEVKPEDEIIVKKQLTTAYKGIMNLEFSQGCEDPDCYWCKFTNDIKTI